MPLQARCSHSTEPKLELEACALAYVMTIHSLGGPCRCRQQWAGYAQAAHAIKKRKNAKVNNSCMKRKGPTSQRGIAHSCNNPEEGLLNDPAVSDQSFSTLSHRESQEVEDLCAIPPRIGVAILSLALVKEPVHLHGGGQGLLKLL